MISQFTADILKLLLTGDQDNKVSADVKSLVNRHMHRMKEEDPKQYNAILVRAAENQLTAENQSSPPIKQSAVETAPEKNPPPETPPQPRVRRIPSAQICVKCREAKAPNAFKKDLPQTHRGWCTKCYNNRATQTPGEPHPEKTEDVIATKPESNPNVRQQTAIRPCIHCGEPSHFTVRGEPACKKCIREGSMHPEQN